MKPEQKTYTIAGKKVTRHDTKVMTLLMLFLIMPGWEILLFHIADKYFAMSICTLARVGIWGLITIAIATRTSNSSSIISVLTAAVAFLMLVPVEMIFSMSIDHRAAMYIGALTRLLFTFGIMIATATSSILD